MNAASLNSTIPIISVLLPIHNAERYIREAVESILAQTFSDFELLALDDGSNDRSLSILREFEAKDSRMRVLSRENRGLVPTLNELISLAHGRYLARMDGDDICRSQRFEKQVAYLDAHPECVALGSAILFIDPTGMPIREFVYESTHDEIDSAHLSGVSESRMCHPSVMMRREAVLEVGKYREEYRFAQDMDLLLRLAEIGKLANLPEVLLEYRHHFKSICYSHGDRQRNYARQAVRSAWARRGIIVDPEMPEPAMKSETSGETHRTWAWWALSAGNVMTARKHAIRAFVKNPFNKENLRVLACAIRGY